jgi:glycerophosphoryl diester phosphodiesterase
VNIIGHRGSNFNDGENTLRAITKALNDKADGIEVDLRAVENNIIILHDETVNRTTDGSGHYKSFSPQSIRFLR